VAWAPRSYSSGVARVAPLRRPRAAFFSKDAAFSFRPAAKDAVMRFSPIATTTLAAPLGAIAPIAGSGAGP